MTVFGGGLHGDRLPAGRGAVLACRRASSARSSWSTWSVRCPRRPPGGWSAGSGGAGALYLAGATTAAGLLLSLSDSLALVLLGLVLITAGFFAGHAVASSSVSRTAKKGRAQASALYQSAYYLGSSAGSTLGRGRLPRGRLGRDGGAGAAGGARRRVDHGGGVPRRRRPVRFTVAAPAYAQHRGSPPPPTRPVPGVLRAPDPRAALRPLSSGPHGPMRSGARGAADSPFSRRRRDP